MILPEQLIRIGDPDQPVYRIYPLWGLEEALRLRQWSSLLRASGKTHLK